MDQVNITFFFFFNFDTRSHCLVPTDLDFVEQTGFKLKNRPVFFFYSAFPWEVSFVFILTFCVACTGNATTLFKVFRSLWFLCSQSWFLLPSEFCVLEVLKIYKIILYFFILLNFHVYLFCVCVCHSNCGVVGQFAGVEFMDSKDWAQVVRMAASTLTCWATLLTLLIAF